MTLARTLVLASAVVAATAPLALAAADDARSRCNAQWLQMENDHQTAGQTRYAFMKSCLKQEGGGGGGGQTALYVLGLALGVGAVAGLANGSHSEKPSSP